MSFSKVIFAWLACAPLAYAGNGLVVEPGKSVTLIDASDPTMHVVVTAPHDSQLDLSRLLAANGKSSILSIVTAAQVKPAGSMVKNEDGTISIAPAAATALPQAALADRAVLVFNEGRYVGASTGASSALTRRVRSPCSRAAAPSR